MTQTTAINCNQCGAALDVAPGTRFVTCLHCGAKLEVHRTDASAFTDVLENVEQNTAKAAGNLEIMRLQQELDHLDRQWQSEHPGMAIPGGPGAAAGNMGSIFGLAIFAVVWLIGAFGIAASAASMGAPVIFPIFAAGLGLVGAVVMGSALMKMLNASGSAGSNTFLLQRQQLVDRLAQVRARVG